MLQAMVVNRKDGKGANKIEQNASNTCIPCSKPYRFPAQTTRKHPKTLSLFFAPYRFTGLRDCPTQCARLLHPASTRVLPAVANIRHIVNGRGSLLGNPSHGYPIHVKESMTSPIHQHPDCLSVHIGKPKNRHSCWYSRSVLCRSHPTSRDSTNSQ